MATKFKKIIFALLFAIFLSSTAHAQSPSTNIIGTIVDTQTRQPIANATVSIATASTQTNAFGNFSLTVPIAEPYQFVAIIVTAPGYGDWTMHDAMLFPNIARTLRIELGQQDQTFVQGLPRALTGELQSTPPISPQPYAPSYYSNSVLPPTIRVAITSYANCSDWVNAGEPIVRVDTIAFETYAKNVLPNEWLASWGNNAPESLRAGAMAVKMFAWWRINLGGVRAGGMADVVNNTCDQRYIANTNDPRTDAAVNWTWVALMRRNGQVIEIHYLATMSQCQASPYQPCMPQWGTYNDALAGMDWQSILHKYYDPVQINFSQMFLPMVER